VSAQIALSPSFSLPDPATLPADITTPLHRVTLPFDGAKMNSLPPLHLPAMLYPVAFPLESKLKNWIHTTTAGHSPRIVRLSPSTSIKGHLNLDHSSHHSIVSPFCLLTSPGTMPSELHPPLSFPFTALSHAHHSSAQWHSWWQTSWPLFTSRTSYRHVNLRKKYFKIPQHHTGLSTSILSLFAKLIFRMFLLCTFW
jgi:hypothetical protein